MSCAMQTGVAVKKRKIRSLFIRGKGNLILENATESVPQNNFHVRDWHAKNPHFKNSGNSESD